MEPGARWTLPAARGDDTVRVAYVFAGSSLVVEGTEVPHATGAVLDPSAPVTLSTPAGVEVLVLQGRPIGEPVAQHGPFVMTTQEQIAQAYDDYRRASWALVPGIF